MTLYAMPPPSLLMLARNDDYAPHYAPLSMGTGMRLFQSLVGLELPQDTWSIDFTFIHIYR